MRWHRSLQEGNTCDGFSYQMEPNPPTTVRSLQAGPLRSVLSATSRMGAKTDRKREDSFLPPILALLLQNMVACMHTGHNPFSHVLHYGIFLLRHDAPLPKGKCLSSSAELKSSLTCVNKLPVGEKPLRIKMRRFENHRVNPSNEIEA